MKFYKYVFVLFLLFNFYCMISTYFCKDRLLRIILRTCMIHIQIRTRKSSNVQSKELYGVKMMAYGKSTKYLHRLACYEEKIQREILRERFWYLSKREGFWCLLSLTAKISERKYQGKNVVRRDFDFWCGIFLSSLM